jgi:hypothetical protein
MYPKGKRLVNVAHCQFVINYCRLRVAAWLEGIATCKRFTTLSEV